MPESRSKKITANRIARKFKGEYITGPGPDIICPTCTIAVESVESLHGASRKLSGHRVPVYVAVTRKADVYAAIEKFAHTTIGVMDNQGRIIKKFARKKRIKKECQKYRVLIILI